MKTYDFFFDFFFYIYNFFSPLLLVTEDNDNRSICTVQRETHFSVARRLVGIVIITRAFCYIGIRAHCIVRYVCRRVTRRVPQKNKMQNYFTVLQRSTWGTWYIIKGSVHRARILQLRIRDLSSVNNYPVESNRCSPRSRGTAPADRFDHHSRKLLQAQPHKNPNIV